MFAFTVAVVHVVAICATLSAQADSCQHQKVFDLLLNDLIETKVNSTLRNDLDRLVEAEVNELVAGAVNKRIEEIINQTLNVELESRVKDHVETALADEPGMFVCIYNL